MAFLGGILKPEMLCVGHIKVGMNGPPYKTSTGKTAYKPMKFSYFRLTTCERNQHDNNNLFMDDALIGSLGDKIGRDRQGNITSFPIRLMYNTPELNFPTSLICYKGAIRVCSGDGEGNGIDRNGINVKCPCPRPPGECSISGVLSVLIEGAEMFGGCWKFRTKGRNSCNAILASLYLIQEETRTKQTPNGCLAWLPLRMVVYPKSTVTPEGYPTVVPVVSIVYPGPRERLYQHAIELTEQKAQMLIDMQRTETKLLISAVPVDEEEEADVAKEFYPDEAVNEVPLPPKETIEEGEPAIEKPKAQAMRQRTVVMIPASEGKKAVMSGGITNETIMAIKAFKDAHKAEAGKIIDVHLAAMNLSKSPHPQDFTEAEGQACLAELKTAFEQPQEPEHVNAEIIPPEDDFVDQVHCPNAACLIPRANCGPCKRRIGCPEVPQEPLADEEPPF